MFLYQLVCLSALFNNKKASMHNAITASIIKAIIPVIGDRNAIKTVIPNKRTILYL